jgi:hypothetical protein
MVFRTDVAPWPHCARKLNVARPLSESRTSRAPVATLAAPAGLRLAPVSPRGTSAAPVRALNSHRASGFGGRRDAERADAPRSRKAGAPIRRGESGLCDPRRSTARPAHRCAWHVSSTRIRTRRDIDRVRGATDFPARGAAPAAGPACPVFTDSASDSCACALRSVLFTRRRQQ